MKYSITVILLLLASSVLGQTQVPNVFQAGQPARADDVNANFSTLESAANQNASDVAANSGDIQANQASIQTNATNIATLGGQSGSRIYSQGQPIGWFLSSTSASALGTRIYIISDTGYLFQGRWYDSNGDRYLSSTNYYFSDPGCTGNVYFEVSNRVFGTWGSVFRPNQDATATAYGNYYVPRGSDPVMTTVNSREANIAGDCLDEVTTRNYFLALPNDEAVTGVPDIEPPLPYTIGVP